MTPSDIYTCDMFSSANISGTILFSAIYSRTIISSGINSSIHLDLTTKIIPNP